MTTFLRPRNSESVTSWPFWSLRVKSGALAPTARGAVMAGSLPADSATHRLGGDQPGGGPVLTGVDGAGRVQPGRGGGLLEVAGVHVAGATGLGGEDDDRTALGEVGEPVHD